MTDRWAKSTQLVLSFPYCVDASRQVSLAKRERFNRCGLASEIPFSFTALMNSVDLHDRDDVLFKRSIKYNDVLHSFELLANQESQQRLLCSSREF
jgi:hypothetical protein